ncbi:uncharacterized protein PG998_009266 [Apiospora kogelbergensis]|uniref:uncharacterized protein n=1 Tax=Apiospora kogelbergensis TaxID=1337665 RepID=UPI0031315364
MSAVEKKNESRGLEDLGYKVGIGLLACQQSVACAFTEYNAFRFGSIPRHHTVAATVLFYPGLYLAWRRLYTWADDVFERQKLRRREALRVGSPKNTAALPKSPREIGFMSPQWAPGLIALFAMNLRSRQVHRSLEFCYQVWSPRSHVGLLLFILIQNSILSSTFIGAGAYLVSEPVEGIGTRDGATGGVVVELEVKVRVIFDGYDIIHRIHRALGLIWARYLELRDQVQDIVVVGTPYCRVANGASRDSTRASVEVVGRACAVGAALAALANTGDRRRRAAAGGSRGRGLGGAGGREDGHRLRVSLYLPEAETNFVDGVDQGDSRQYLEKGPEDGGKLLLRRRDGHLLQNQLGHGVLLHDPDGLTASFERRHIVARRQRHLLVQPLPLLCPLGVLA